MGVRAAPGWGRWAGRLGFCALVGLVTAYIVAWGCAAFVRIDALQARDAYTVFDHRVWQARIMGGSGNISVDWSSNTGYKAGTDWNGRPVPDEALWAHANQTGAAAGAERVRAPAWGRPHIEDGEPGKPWIRGAVSVAHGWPRLALWCSVREDVERIAAWEKALVPVGPPSTPPPPNAAFPTQAMVSSAPRPLIVAGGFASPVTALAVNPLTDMTLLAWRPIWGGLAVNTALYASLWFGLLFGPGTLRRWMRDRRGGCRACGYDLGGQFDGGCPECGWGRV